MTIQLPVSNELYQGRQFSVKDDGMLMKKEKSTTHKLMVRPVDSRQDELTREYIIPHLPSIIGDFEALRDSVDREVERFILRRQGKSSPSGLNQKWFDITFDPDILLCEVHQVLQDLPNEKLHDYPVGECMTITGIVYRLFNQDTLVKDRKGFSKLRDFISSGGDFHMIWGGIRGVFFQTSFQVGSHYIDVANDTVDRTKKKVIHSSLAESGFRSILSYADYIPIRTGYHEVSLYLNNCFPELLPYYPLLAVSKKDGRCTLDTSLYMAGLNIDTRFQTVTDAVLSEKVNQTLDDGTLGRLAGLLNKMEGAKDKRKWMAYGVMNQTEMIRFLERQASEFDRSEHYDRLRTAGKIAHTMNAIWHSSPIIF
jgi:hypothetical protein